MCNVDVAVADPEEVQCILVDSSFDIPLDLHAGGWCARASISNRCNGSLAVKVGNGYSVIDCSTEIGTSPSMTKGEVLVHWHSEVVSQIADGHLRVCPGASPVHLVFWIIVISNMVGVATIPVVGELEKSALAQV